MITIQQPSLECLIPGFLYKNPLHGYELIKQIKSDQAVQLIWQGKASKIYFWLKKLEDKGRLTGKLIPGETHPNRTEYHLTPEGEAFFLKWIQTPVTKPRHMRLTLLCRLHFAVKININLAHKLLAAQKLECQQWLDDLKEKASGVGQDEFIARQIINYRSKQVNSMLQWLHDCQQELI